MQFSAEERRRHERVTAPAITIQVDDVLYQTRDWSMGGFMIEGYEGKLSPGALFTLARMATLKGDLTPVRVRSRVVRADPDRQRLMVGFLAVDEQAYAILSEHMAKRMRFLKEQQDSA
jgi:PilZ domain